MTAQKHSLGWYLYNALRSDLADTLVDTVDRFVPCLHGGRIKKDRSWTPSKAAGAAEEGDKATLQLSLLQALEGYAARPDGPPDLIETNVAHVATALNLCALERDILLLVIWSGVSRRFEMRIFIDAAWEATQDLAPLLAALLDADAHVVEALLGPTAKLVRSGLIDIGELSMGTFSTAVKPMPRIVRLMRHVYDSPERCVQAMIGTRVETRLRWTDFAHLHAAAEIAARLLRRAAAEGEMGVHVLLSGPAGTGKTELAKALAARAGLNLFAAGEAEEDEEGGGAEPSRSERFAALRLTGTLLAHMRKAAVLLDEAEDVLDAPRSFGTRREAFSKAFLHRTLETLQVPVIWTCNDLRLMDPATLRRMTMVIDVPVPNVAARTRIWRRVIARERLRLPADAPERLARRWDASAGLAASAARAARLTGGGEVVIERAMSGVLGAMGRRETPECRETVFDADLVSCAQDLRTLCDRLGQPGTSRAWSLCLSGPPGTGKSEFARYMARRLDLPVLQKRASDLLSMFVGGSEKAIARAFREARDLGALLLIDEAEALLFDRGAARHAWEISQVNEMLTWMEDHPLPFVCTTNMSARMDQAVPRRFSLKLHFGAMDRAQAVLGFRRLLLAEPPGPLPEGLTPGDFAVVRKKAALFAERDPRILLGWLREELEAKAGWRAEIGFRMERRDPEPLVDEASRPFPRAA